MRARSGLAIATCGAWIAGLALAAWGVSSAALCAAVIDDFNGDQPGWTLWNPPAAPSDPEASATLFAKRLRITTKFTTATDPANPVPHLCNVYYSTSLPVQQGKRLELRADLVTVNLGNLFACLVTVDTKGGEYVLLWDKDEVGLFKWSQSEGFSVAFWETHTGGFLDVVLALALTLEGDDLLIAAKVIRKSSGTVVFERTVRDTPGSDWGVPDPLPRGWQIFGPDAGAPHKDDLKGVGLGVLHDTDGQQATAIVQFDNLEYRSFLPPQTYVIDDFEQGRKFTLFEFGHHPEWEISDGQLHARLPVASSSVSFIYCRLYELPEGQPVQFSVDLVSANTADVFASLSLSLPFEVLPPGADRGYALYVLHNRVIFLKPWEGGAAWYFNEVRASNTQPKTLSLTLTREGANLRIGAKVVLRDDPRTVLFSQERIDTPQVDVGDDPGPPPAGPVWEVILNCARTSTLAEAEVVFDNLVCSQDTAPSLLGIQRKGATEARLFWPEYSKCVLESDSIEGPWRPCPEPVSLGEGAYTCALPLPDSARYFRLAQGFCCFDSFEGLPRLVTWKTTSVVPGEILRPDWFLDAHQSRGRIVGEGSRNVDFTLRWGNPYWYRDCVGTVDIVDWGDAMEDATFGILLRARPETEMWFNNPDGLPEERYAGLLTFKKADNPAESALSIAGPAGAVLKEQPFPAVNPDREYRLRFWAVGDQLTLELFDKENLEAPIQSINVTDGRIQDGLHALYGTKSAGGAYEVWIDEYSLNGTTVH